MNIRNIKVPENRIRRFIYAFECIDFFLFYISIESKMESSFSYEWVMIDRKTGTKTYFRDSKDKIVALDKTGRIVHFFDDYRLLCPYDEDSTNKNIELTKGGEENMKKWFLWDLSYIIKIIHSI